VEKKVLHIRGLYQTILICKDPKDFRCVHQLKKCSVGGAGGGWRPLL